MCFAENHQLVTEFSEMARCVLPIAQLKLSRSEKQRILSLLVFAKVSVCLVRLYSQTTQHAVRVFGGHVDCKGHGLQSVIAFEVAGVQRVRCGAVAAAAIGPPCLCLCVCVCVCL